LFNALYNYNPTKLIGVVKIKW